MKPKQLYIFTRTPLHVGAGSSVGAIDQPVQRERHTNHPIIPGSAIKGVLRNHFFHTKGNEFCEENFGKATNEESFSGKFSISEAKILLFPLRSAAGAFAMATCPHALSRLEREGHSKLKLDQPPKPGFCLAGSDIKINDHVVVEEYAFETEGPVPSEIVSTLCEELLNDHVLKASKERLLILSDEDFSFFVKNATEIRNHNRIDPMTGTVDGSGFFNEEVVPSESLFVSTIYPVERSMGEKSSIFDDFSSESILQFGGNATTGLGFCTVKAH